MSHCKAVLGFPTFRAGSQRLKRGQSFQPVTKRHQNLSKHCPALRKCLAWRTQGFPRMSEGLMEKSLEARALGFASWVCRSLAPPPCLTWSLQWEGGATQLFSKLTPEYCSHSRCKHSVENWGPVPRATNKRHLRYSKDWRKPDFCFPGTLRGFGRKTAPRSLPSMRRSAGKPVQPWPWAGASLPHQQHTETPQGWFLRHFLRSCLNKVPLDSQ